MGVHKIAILVSGSGTNAVNIIEYFEKKNTAQVTLIISNKEGSQVLKKAQDKGVENVVFNNESSLLSHLQQYSASSSSYTSLASVYLLGLVGLGLAVEPHMSSSQCPAATAAAWAA